MSIVLLNMVVVSIVIGVACFLSILAITLIIVSIVRSVRAKKKGQKTMKIGLWVGGIMLISPWLVLVLGLILAEMDDAKLHRWDVDRELLAEAVMDKDAEEIYDMMSDDVVARNNITLQDVEEFLDQCDTSNVTEENMDKYTEMSQPDWNHYRAYLSNANNRRQPCFQYKMYNVNDEESQIFISGVSGDEENEDCIGIYYISYKVNGNSVGIGEQAPKEH